MNKPPIKRNSTISVPLYLGTENNCEYLAEQQSRIIFTAPDFVMTNEIYSQLAVKGFRRSGAMVYHPQCDSCAACIPLRIPVNDFRPNRAQRRILVKNSDLNISHRRPAFDEECYDLYSRYLHARHGEGNMAESTPDDFLRFLSSPWSDTKFIEFRLSNKLVCIAATDYLSDGLSSFYTFFDPAYSSRSLGSFSILWQIQSARKLDANWLYLGFWIQRCRKMSYKNQYRPVETYTNGAWRRFEKNENMVSLNGFESRY